MISEAKFDGFRGWEVGKVGEMLDPLETKRIHGSKSTKVLQTNKSQKNWAYFWWGFSKLGEEHNKIRLENKKGGFNFVRNPGS